jgi:hypothetical protein
MPCCSDKISTVSVIPVFPDSFWTVPETMTYKAMQRVGIAKSLANRKMNLPDFPVRAEYCLRQVSNGTLVRTCQINITVHIRRLWCCFASLLTNINNTGCKLGFTETIV